MFPTDEEIIAVLMMLDDTDYVDGFQEETGREWTRVVPSSDTHDGRQVADPSRQARAAEYRKQMDDRRGRQNAGTPVIDPLFGDHHKQVKQTGEKDRPYRIRAFAGTMQLAARYGCSSHRHWPTTDVNQTIRPFARTQLFFYNGDMIDLACSLKRTHPTNRIGIECFANNTKMGGGVDNGAMAQEEQLCRRSTLYNALRLLIGIDGKYKIGTRQKPSGFRHNNPSIEFEYGTAIFKDVVILRQSEALEFADEPIQIHVDVISTCAPVMTNHQDRVNDIHTQTLMKTLTRNVIRAAAINRCDILIIGLLGGGAFKGDTKTIAQTTLDAIQAEQGAVETIVFAVMSDHNNPAAAADSKEVMSAVTVLPSAVGEIKITDAIDTETKKRWDDAQAYVDFLCNGGKSKAPDGNICTLDELGTKSIQFMEDNHNYIQCMFPSSTYGVNLNAWLLHSETARMIVQNQATKDRINFALRIILNFYGISEGATGLFQMKRQTEPPHSILTIPVNDKGFNHNWQRVSRILGFLVLIGQKARAQNLLAFLYHIDIATNKFTSKVDHWLPAVYGVNTKEINEINGEQNEYLRFILYDGNISAMRINDVTPHLNGEHDTFSKTNFFGMYFPVDIFHKNQFPVFMTREMTMQYMQNTAYAAKIEPAIELALNMLGFQTTSGTIVSQTDEMRINWRSYNITTVKHDVAVMWARLYRIFTFLLYAGKTHNAEQILMIVNKMIGDHTCKINIVYWKYLIDKYNNVTGSMFTFEGQGMNTPATDEQLKAEEDAADAAAAAAMAAAVAAATAAVSPQQPVIGAQLEYTAEKELEEAEPIAHDGQIDFAQVRMALLIP